MFDLVLNTPLSWTVQYLMIYVAKSKLQQRTKSKNDNILLLHNFTFAKIYVLKIYSIIAWYYGHSLHIKAHFASDNRKSQGLKYHLQPTQCKYSFLPSIKALMIFLPWRALQCLHFPIAKNMKTLQWRHYSEMKR